MNLSYQSTRGTESGLTASQAILKGLADDGGLFMPTYIPKLEVPMEQLAKMSYQETAYQVMKLFLSDFTEEELRYCINSAYDSKFDTEEIAPLVKADGAYYLELFHGSTIAFKDMALSILPYLMTTSAKKNHVENEIVILTATSGDTGKAAMAGFADVPGTLCVIIFLKAAQMTLKIPFLHKLCQSILLTCRGCVGIEIGIINIPADQRFRQYHVADPDRRSQSFAESIHIDHPPIPIHAL